LSLPDLNFCPDKGRRSATIDHLLLDYALGRKDTAFESKEHIYSFLLGWVDRLWLKRAVQQRFARFVLDEGNRDVGHDLHWHAFSPELALELVVATLALAERGGRLLAFAHSRNDWNATRGNIFVTYELGAGSLEGFEAPAVDACATALGRIREAAAIVERMRAALAEAHPGREAIETSTRSSSEKPEYR